MLQKKEKRTDDADVEIVMLMSVESDLAIPRHYSNIDCDVHVYDDSHVTTYRLPPSLPPFFLEVGEEEEKEELWRRS